MSDMSIAPNSNAKSFINKTETSDHSLKDQIFTETTQSIHTTAIGLGYLPLNEEIAKLLILGGYENRRVSNENKTFDQDIDSHNYKIEPQLQLNLFENSKNFLSDSQLYFRIQYDITDNAAKAMPLNHNANNELVHKFADENFVLRNNLIINNLSDPEARKIKYMAAPFIKTPGVLLPIVKDIKLRLAPEYSRDFNTKEDQLQIHAKMEGVIKSTPWWGWSIQTFWAVDIESKKEQKKLDFSGLYFWTGSVLPKNWMGEAFFLEGGIWLGKNAFNEESVSLPKSMVFGFNLKFKFGTECRWWQ